MEQIKELLTILEQTPEMALWGLFIWCIYILAKLASVVYAIKSVLQLGINKWHDLKVKSISIEESKIDLENSHNSLKLKERDVEFKLSQIRRNKEYADINLLAKKFDKGKIKDVEMSSLIELLDSIKSTTYIHKGDIEKAIKKLKD